MAEKSSEKIEVKAIISGLFYLSEESYRSGHDEIGLILRNSILGIQRHLFDVHDEVIGGDFSTEDLQQLFELLDILRTIPNSKKQHLLKALDEGSLKDIH